VFPFSLAPEEEEEEEEEEEAPKRRLVWSEHLRLLKGSIEHKPIIKVQGIYQGTQR
jgi:hypothetical protein